MGNNRERFGYMKIKLIAMGIGLLIGISLSIVVLIQPVENTPRIILQVVRKIALFFHYIFMPNTDRMGSFIIEIPIIFILFTLTGGLLGYLTGYTIEKHGQAHHEQTQE